MVIILAVMTPFIFLLLIYASKKVVDGVLSPLERLRELCQSLRKQSMDLNIPLQASSKDMKVLLKSFSEFVVSNLFSSTSSERRDYSIEDLKFLYEALSILKTTGNRRGEGACLNNIGSIHFSYSDFVRAADCFGRSICIAEELLESARHEDERRSLYKDLSDRLHNSALVLIEKGKCAQADQSFNQQALTVLRSALGRDMSHGYIRGCLSKQL